MTVKKDRVLILRIDPQLETVLATHREKTFEPTSNFVRRAILAALETSERAKVTP